MTWAEYLIRVDGYRRIELRTLERMRRGWFNQLWGPHVDPKKLPKTERAYMPLSSDKGGKNLVSEATREKFKNAVELWKQQTGKTKI